jgi:hypothetical protein
MGVKRTSPVLDRNDVNDPKLPRPRWRCWRPYYGGCAVYGGRLSKFKSERRLSIYINML